ncbi:MAG: hypothetical protein JRE71_15000, partial [Deltaproteobacteria bacterium]|nr:hypothetical protein [Deltaproteobacteria bacterium]
MSFSFHASGRHLVLQISGLFCASLLTATAPDAAAKQPTALAAGRIAVDTSEGVRIRGSDAIAGVGDWYLSNGTLCAAVLGEEHHGQLVPGG